MMKLMKNLGAEISSYVEDAERSGFEGIQISIYCMVRRLLPWDETEESAKCKRVARQVTFQCPFTDSDHPDTHLETENWIVEKLRKMRIKAIVVDRDKILEEVKLKVGQM